MFPLNFSSYILLKIFFNYQVLSGFLSFSCLFFLLVLFIYLFIEV